MDYVDYNWRAHELLSSGDMKLMEDFLSNLYSNQEPQRTYANNLLHCCMSNHSSILVMKLVYVLRCMHKVEAREMSARTLILVEAHNLWPKFPPHLQSNMKTELLECLQKSDSLPVLRIVSWIVSKILCQVYRGSDQWDQLLGFLVRSVGSGTESSQEFAFLVFSCLDKDCRMVICDALRSLASQGMILRNGLIRGLASNNPDLKIAAFCAAVNLIPSFPGYDSHYGMAVLFQSMHNGVLDFLRSQNEAHARTGIEELIRFVIEEPKSLEKSLNTFVSSMMKIFEILDFKEGTEDLTVRFLMSLAEAKALESVMHSLHHDCIAGLFMLLTRMLVRIEDDVAWYDMDSREGENAGTSESFNSGVNCLCQLSTALGGKNILDVVFSVLQRSMSAQLWQLRHTGISILSVVAKACSEEIVMAGGYLDKVVEMILKSFNDPHPRVCWAAFHFMQLQTDLVGAIQILHHSRVLPALIFSFDEQRSPRVKQQIASALFNFIKNLSGECLKSYMDLDAVMKRLFILLKGNSKTTEERKIALGSFNLVAQKCSEIGIKHYSYYLPALLEACTDKNPEIKSEATHGIRVCAEFGGSAFKTFVQNALSKLAAVAVYPNRIYSEDVKASAIAVSAIGKICEFHSDTVNVSQLIPAWLNLLPVKEGLTEAKVVHEQLRSMFERSNAELLGQNYENLQKIVAIFLEVVSHGDNLAKTETATKMRDSLRDIWMRFPPSILDAIFMSLNTELQATLMNQVLC